MRTAEKTSNEMTNFDLMCSMNEWARSFNAVMVYFEQISFNEYAFMNL